MPPDLESQRPEDEERPVSTGSGAHLSFVQRLRQRFGKVVDPQINLQEHEEEEAGEGEGARQGDSPSSSSRGLYHKLSRQPALGPRYRVIQEIARGGMGTVLRVWDDDLRRNMAMKVMLGPADVEGQPEVEGTPRVDDEKLGRFLEEAQITGQLDHPGIVPVHSLGIDERGRIYFTMRLVRGRELKEVLDLARTGGENWTLTKALALILKVCEAMAFAHSKGVVHRDLKPANVMVGRFGETYVMDWGLARVLGRHDTHDMRLKPAEDPSALSLVRTVRKDESLSNPESPLVTMDGDVVGTPSFMSPEQAQGKLEEVGSRSDVYSLGAILYYMLTGRAPYVKPGERVSPHTVLNRVLQGPPVPVGKLAKDAPGELVAICEKAMAHDTQQRYASMLEVADDIQAFLEGRVVRAYEGGAIAEFRKWVARNRAMAAAIAAMALIVLASAFGFAYQKSRQVRRIQNEQSLTETAKHEAEQNLKKAESNARQAQENLDLALDRKGEADRNAAISEQNMRLARASGYMANVIAAEFCLRLHDVVEARRRLAECDTELRSWEWKHLDLRTHMALRSFDFGRTVIDGVAFGATADSFVAVSRAGRVRVVDAATGEVLPPDDIVVDLTATFQTLPINRRGLDVARDGSRVLLFGMDQTARAYDLRTGQRVADALEASTGHEQRVTSGAFSPDGRLFATGDAGGGLLLCDGATGSVARRLQGHGREVTALAWSPDSARFASASADDTLRVWSASTGELEFVLRGHQDDVLDVAWSPDGKRIASGGADHTVILWGVEGGVLERSLHGHEEAVNAVDFHPQGEGLLSGSDDQTLRLWDLVDQGSVVLHGHQGPILQAGFSPDGRLIVTSSADNTIKVWDAAGDLSSTVLDDVRAAVLCAAYHPGGERLVTGHHNHQLVVWDALSGEVLQVLRGHESHVSAVAISPDGKTVLSGAGDKTARLWDLESGRELLSLGPHDKWVETVAFAPDGTWLATGTGAGGIYVYDAKNGELLRKLEGQRRWINALAVSPDGKLIAAGGGDRMISVWRDFGPQAFLELTALDRGGIKDLAFGPDGRLYSAGTTDPNVRVWDLQSDQPVLILKGHEGTVTSLAVSSDGTRVVTGATDQTVRVWDAFSGGSLLVLPGHQAEIMEVLFSPDDSRILSASRDMTARLWESGDVERRRAARMRARELREQAEPLVEALFADHFFLQDVELNLRAAPRLDEELRATCLRLARLQGDDPALLDRLTRQVVLRPGLERAGYEQALRRALAACSLDREHPWLLSTLGIAQYRAGDYAAAVETLRAAQELDEQNAGNQRSGRTKDSPFDEEETVLLLTYRAMAEHHAGDPAMAVKCFADARECDARSGVHEHSASAAMALDEARALVGEAAASSPLGG